MPSIGPVKRRELIAALKKLGFTGPYPGGKHEYMARGNASVRVPNPHRGDIGTDLLKNILKQAGVDRDEWESV